MFRPRNHPAGRRLSRHGNAHRKSASESRRGASCCSSRCWPGRARRLVGPLGWSKGLLAGFDARRDCLPSSCVSLFGHDAKRMREIAEQDDANRVMLLVISFLLSVVILAAVIAELGQDKLELVDKLLVAASLVLVWTVRQCGLHAPLCAFVLHRRRRRQGSRRPRISQDEGAADERLRLFRLYAGGRGADRRRPDLLAAYPQGGHRALRRGIFLQPWRAGADDQRAR